MNATTDHVTGPLSAHDSRWELAACRQVDPELHHHGGHVQIARAREICDRCPLTGADGPCLARSLEAEAGLSAERRAGVFAGTTPQERADMEKENA